MCWLPLLLALTVFLSPPSCQDAKEDFKGIIEMTQPRFYDAIFQLADLCECTGLLPTLFLSRTLALLPSSHPLRCACAYHRACAHRDGDR